MVTEVWAYRHATLRGVDLVGFEVEGLDGFLGRVERSAIDAVGGYLVVNAGALAPLGGRVLLPAGLVDDVDLDLERLFVRLTRAEIAGAPEYDWQLSLEQQEPDRFATYYAAHRPASPPAPDAARPRLEPVAESTQVEKTKRELYAEARTRGIPGRSKMSKAELVRAVGQHSQ
jgi:hypothetical protein